MENHSPEKLKPETENWLCIICDWKFLIARSFCSASHVQLQRCTYFGDSSYTLRKGTATGFTQKHQRLLNSGMQCQSLLKKIIANKHTLLQRYSRIEWSILRKVHKFAHSTVHGQNPSNQLISWNSSFIAENHSWLLDFVQSYRMFGQGSRAKGQRDHEPAVLSQKASKRIYLEKPPANHSQSQLNNQTSTSKSLNKCHLHLQSFIIPSFFWCSHCFFNHQVTAIGRGGSVVVAQAVFPAMRWRGVEPRGKDTWERRWVWTHRRCQPNKQEKTKLSLLLDGFVIKNLPYWLGKFRYVFPVSYCICLKACESSFDSRGCTSQCYSIRNSNVQGDGSVLTACKKKKSACKWTNKSYKSAGE